MIDIGVNLLHPQFDEDREQVVDRALTAGITGMLLTSTDIATSRSGIALCESRSDWPIWCTAGVHPHDAAGVAADWIDTLVDLAASSKVKAVGETGLDFHRNFSPPQAQREAFATQLDLAVDLSLPVFVHDRDSNGETFALLNARRQSLRGMVVHCFTGNHTDLHRYLDAGCYIGITGWVCDRRRGAELRELVRQLPLERLLIETDAPFLRPHNAPRAIEGRHRRRNEPALLNYVVDTLVDAMGIQREAVVETTRVNAETLFRLEAES